MGGLVSGGARWLCARAGVRGEAPRSHGGAPARRQGPTTAARTHVRDGQAPHGRRNGAGERGAEQRRHPPCWLSSLDRDWSIESLSFVHTAVELRVRFGFNCFAREKKNGNTRNSRAVPLSDQMRVLVVGEECARPHFVAKNPVITDLQPEPAINRETWSKVLAVFLSEKRRGRTDF